MICKNEEKLLEEQLLIQLENKLKDKEIIEPIRTSFNIVRKKSERSKNKYFLLKYVNILLAGIITALSAYSSKFGETDLVNLLQLVSPILLTILTSIEMLRKYDETWKRHRKNYITLQLEIISFVNGAGIYELCTTAEDAETKFKNRIIECFSGNYKKFEENMKDTSK